MSGTLPVFSHCFCFLFMRKGKALQLPDPF